MTSIILSEDNDPLITSLTNAAAAKNYKAVSTLAHRAYQQHYSLTYLLDVLEGNIPAYTLVKSVYRRQSGE